MKRLLVVGDSYMAVDPKHPGTHFTELLKKNFEVFNFASPGLTNHLIFRQLIKGLELNPDFVFVWFTESKRLEFENRKNKWLPDYITDCNFNDLDNNQIQLMKYYFSETPIELLDLKTALDILGILSFLRSKNIKFFYHYGLFHNIISKLDMSVRLEFANFKKELLSEISFRDNLNRFSLDPSYHSDYEWQHFLAKTVSDKFSNL